MTTGIIDYGSGNLHSVLKAFQLMAGKHGQTAALISTAQELHECSHIVLPGVGAFGDCVAGLKALPGMWDALNEAVLQERKPFFGICVGMQMMLQRGLEHGEHAGLDWIEGSVVPLHGGDAVVREAQQRPPPVPLQPAHRKNNGDEASAERASPLVGEAVRPIARSSSAAQGQTLKIPHMGWNELTFTRTHPVLAGLEDGTHVYFVHSYYARCARTQDVLATTDYGVAITACIGKDNMLGTQFHPEKSGVAGLQIIENFVQWDGRV